MNNLSKLFGCLSERHRFDIIRVKRCIDEVIMLAKKVICLSLLLAIMSAASALNAQRAGLQTGIAPSGTTPGYAQIYAQFPADHQPRAVAIPSVPQVFHGYGHSFGNAYGNGIGYGYGNGFGIGATVIAPNSTVITNSTVIIQQPIVPAVAVGIAPIPAQRPAVVTPVTPVATGAPAVGTPRQQVIQQFGNPTTTMYTRNGETLYFAGGATVFMQNGKVATPQRPN
jgi:hypothetical protein